VWVVSVAERSFVGVGVSLASDDVEYLDFDSDDSLLDWDVVLFRPDISEFYAYETDQYRGKVSLSDGTSFRLKERCEHWRREIKDAVDGGKMVVVFLSELEEVWIDTGRREHSGTGRNRQTTRIVAPYSNYVSIPAELSPIGTKGAAMKLSTRGSECIAPYWREFEKCSQYKVVLSEPGIPACLLTRKGDKPVGAIFRAQPSGGALVLLPELDLTQEGFVEAKADGEQEWTEAAAAFASRLVTALVALDKALHSTDEATPEPQWAKATEYALAKESELKEQLLIAEAALESARRAKETIADDLKRAIEVRGLLYEKGNRPSTPHEYEYATPRRLQRKRALNPVPVFTSVARLFATRRRRTSHPPRLLPWRSPACSRCRTSPRGPRRPPRGFPRAGSTAYRCRRG
jgi:hypothetical protein